MCNVFIFYIRNKNFINMVILLNIQSMQNLLDEITKEEPQLIDHCERVAMLSIALGKRLEVSNNLLHRLYFVALFHDIGKYKTNIRDCSLVSAAIVRSHEEYYKIADYIMQCSENIDGSGPLKMTDENMHLFPMIVRICDIYDDNRMNGLSHDKSLTELRKHSDKIFPKKLMMNFSKMFADNKDLLDFYKRKE